MEASVSETPETLRDRPIPWWIVRDFPECDPERDMAWVAEDQVAIQVPARKSGRLTLGPYTVIRWLRADARERWEEALDACLDAYEARTR